MNTYVHTVFSPSHLLLPSFFICNRRKAPDIIIVLMQSSADNRAKNLSIQKTSYHEIKPQKLHLGYISTILISGAFLPICNFYLVHNYFMLNFITLQKKQVCAQLFDLEKCFKICYVYGKRKPKQFFLFFIQSNFHFYLMNESSSN